ncbi:hypothetical protein M413DRAFT_253179 [Hebeloma cylindrosporum]|uniref:Uncharacterized protein n=1 Tax=Hebeloma cylindrosporum TaxID=76867 RepID=A0A0C3C0Y8_HEBCY|nr:hypothetical protein M413DRAFT_253179 [Hebeloma cylindrosporum h7]
MPKEARRQTYGGLYKPLNFVIHPSQQLSQTTKRTTNNSTSFSSHFLANYE